ncbi:MAG: DoxX family protein [Actinomycetes bacterium]
MIGQTTYSFTATQFDTVMIAARCIVGATMFVHGFNKMFRGGKIQGTANWFEGLGMRPNGKIHAWVASLTEMGTAALMVSGLLTPLAAAAIIGIMVVAAFTDHRGKFLMFKNGCEYVMILATLAAVIGGLGPGSWSLDHALDLTDAVQAGWRGLALSVGLGLGTGLLTLVFFYRSPAPASD